MKNYKFTIEGNKYDVDVIDIVENIAQVEVNGTAYKVEIESGLSAVSKVVAPKIIKAPPAAANSKPAAMDVQVQKAAPAPSNALSVKSPLPGTMLDVYVKEGHQ